MVSVVHPLHTPLSRRRNIDLQDKSLRLRRSIIDSFSELERLGEEGVNILPLLQMKSHTPNLLLRHIISYILYTYTRTETVTIYGRFFNNQSCIPFDDFYDF